MLWNARDLLDSNAHRHWPCLDFTSNSGKELIRFLHQLLSKIAEIPPPKQGIPVSIVADEGEEQARGGKQQG